MINFAIIEQIIIYYYGDRRGVYYDDDPLLINWFEKNIYKFIIKLQILFSNINNLFKIRFTILFYLIIYIIK